MTNILRKNNRYLIFGMLITLQCTALKVHAVSPIHTDEKHLKKLAGFVIASGVISINRNKIRRNKIIKLLAYYTNTHPKDLVDWAVLGTFCWGASNVPKDIKIERFLQTIAFFNPAVQIITTSKTWHYILSKIPIIRSLFTCPDEQCPGICEQCKFISLYKKAPFGYIALLIPHIQQQIIKAKETKKKQQEAQELGCQICMDKNNNVIKVCNNNHFMCPDCKNNWANAGRSESKNCPFCKVKMI